MAANADSVVVELIAKTEQLDKPVQQSAAQFDANMNKIAASATKAEAAVTRSSVARSAALQRESAQISQFSRALGNDMLTVGDLLVSDRSPFVVPVRQAPAAAAGFRAVATAGTVLGGVLETVSGVGIALMIASLIQMIAKSHDAGSEIDELVEKLKEHARQTALSEEADRVWSQTMDALIDRQKRLNDELGKRLTTQEQVDDASLRQAQNDVTRLSGDIAAERAQNESLRKQIAAAKRAPAEGATPEEIQSNEAARAANIARLEADLRKSDGLLAKFNDAINHAQGRVTRGQIILGERQGEAFADLTAKAQLFAENYQGVIRTIEQGNPTLTPFADQINGAADALTKAAADAAAAGVDFASVTNRVSGLDQKLNLGQINVRTYATEVGKLTATLKEMTEAAKEAAKQDPVKNFKAAVIGAEGTGANRAGSPAAGVGQFMPSTFETYFKRLFPADAAKMSNDQIDALRDKRQIAEAVIDAATDDYVKVLKSAGQKVTEASLYTVHVLGEPAARKFLAAPPEASARSVVGNAVANQNGNIFTGTVAEARAQLAKRIGDSSATVSRGATALAQVLDQQRRDAEKAAEQEKRQAAEYADRKSAIEGQILEARKDFGLSAEDVAEIERAAVKLSHDRYEERVRELQREGKLGGDLGELLQKNDDLERARLDVVQRRLRLAQLAEERDAAQNTLTAETGQLDAHQELLRSFEQLATTAKERKAIEDRLIDLQFEEERIQLQAKIEMADRLKALADTTKNQQDIANALKAEADATAARAKLKTLPQRQENAHEQNDRANASPLKAWIQDASDLDTALENVAVHGLNSISSGIADAVLGFRSWGDVARQVLGDMAKMLIEIAVKILIIKGLQALGLGLADGGKVGGLAAGGRPKGYASAGLIIGPGGPTSDMIPIMASNGEFMIREKSAKSIGYGTLEYINRTGKLPPHFAGGGQIESVAPTNMHASMPGGRNGFSQGDIAQLRGIVSDAVRAMPDVSLYASLDPVDMLQRALGRPAGHRALMAHLGNNATAVKATLDRP
jgi:hypothetical protein